MEKVYFVKDELLPVDFMETDYVAYIGTAIYFCILYYQRTW